MSLLRVEHVSQRAGGRLIVRDVSLRVPPGQVVAFLGPNGAGKTTLLRTIMGLADTPPYDYTEHRNGIFFRDELMNDCAVSERIARGLVYLPQHSSLIARLSVRDNLALVGEHCAYWRGDDVRCRFARQFGICMHITRCWQVRRERREAFWERALQLLETVGLQSTLGQRAGTLSGGQKRKIELVRALLLRPQLLMLDEPFAGVDPKSIYELKQFLVELAQSGMTVLISDHYVDQLLSIADLIYVMHEGMIVASGNVRDIMENEYTREMYLGGQFHAEMVRRYTASQ